MDIVYDERDWSKASLHADFSSKPPVVGIALGALAPTIVYTALAVILGVKIASRVDPISLPGIPVILVMMIWLKWVHPSPADISIASNPGYFRDKGNLNIDYEITTWPKLFSGFYLLVMALLGPWLFFN